MSYAKVAINVFFEIHENTCTCFSSMLSLYTYYAMLSNHDQCCNGKENTPSYTLTSTCAHMHMHIHSHTHKHQTWGDYKVHVIDYDYDYLRIS